MFFFFFLLALASTLNKHISRSCCPSTSKIPGLPEILTTITPAKYPGLLGICLSGAGPTILALATDNFTEIATAAQEVYQRVGGFDSFYEVLEVVEDGVTCVEV